MQVQSGGERIVVRVGSFEMMARRSGSSWPSMIWCPVMGDSMRPKMVHAAAQAGPGVMREMSPRSSSIMSLRRRISSGWEQWWMM